MNISQTGNPINQTVEMTNKKKYTILGVCCMSLLIVVIDSTIINVSLPTLHDELHASISGLQWVIDAYTLIMAAFLIMGGSLSDRFGRKKIFMIGLTLFGTGSALCATSSSLGELVTFRIIQAIGGAMLNPVAMSIIAHTFTDSRERAKAIGVWGAVSGIGIALGPILGGLILTISSWHYIFLINIPVILVALVLTWKIIPESKIDNPRKFDPAGQILILIFTFTLIAGIIEAPSRGWGDPLVLALIGISILSLIIFIFAELKAKDPLINPRFFKNPILSASIVGSILVTYMMSSFGFQNTLYLQLQRGFDPFKAGLTLLPLAIGTLLFSPLSGRMVARIGPRIPLSITGVIFILVMGYLLIDNITLNTPYILLLILNALLGAGVGYANSPITNSAISGLPIDQAGVAGGINSMCRQFGQSLGIAIAGSILTSGISDSALKFESSTHILWVIGFICGVVLLGLTLAFIPKSIKKVDEENALILAAAAAEM